MALGYWGENKPYRDYHYFIDWRWIMMEFGTLAIGAIRLWRYRFPFMLMPIAVTLWYYEHGPRAFPSRQERVYDWEIRKFISVWFGWRMTLLAFWVDLRSRFSRDYAFWLYLFGRCSTFWGGLSLMNSGSELGKLAYCGINVLMILAGARLGRRVFAVFGGLGVAAISATLVRVFQDSMIFPVALSAWGSDHRLWRLWQRAKRNGPRPCAASCRRRCAS